MFSLGPINYRNMATRGVRRRPGARETLAPVGSGRSVSWVGQRAVSDAYSETDGTQAELVNSSGPWAGMAECFGHGSMPEFEFSVSEEKITKSARLMDHWQW